MLPPAPISLASYNDNCDRRNLLYVIYICNLRMYLCAQIIYVDVIQSLLEIVFTLLDPRRLTSNIPLVCAVLSYRTFVAYLQSAIDVMELLNVDVAKDHYVMLAPAMQRIAVALRMFDQALIANLRAYVPESYHNVVQVPFDVSRVALPRLVITFSTSSTSPSSSASASTTSSSSSSSSLSSSSHAAAATLSYPGVLHSDTAELAQEPIILAPSLPISSSSSSSSSSYHGAGAGRDSWREYVGLVNKEVMGGARVMKQVATKIQFVVLQVERSRAERLTSTASTTTNTITTPVVSSSSSSSSSTLTPEEALYAELMKGRSDATPFLYEERESNEEFFLPYVWAMLAEDARMRMGGPDEDDVDDDDDVDHGGGGQGKINAVGGGDGKLVVNKGGMSSSSSSSSSTGSRVPVSSATSAVEDYV